MFDVMLGDLTVHLARHALTDTAPAYRLHSRPEFGVTVHIGTRGPRIPALTRWADSIAADTVVLTDHGGACTVTTSGVLDGPERATVLVQAELWPVERAQLHAAVGDELNDLELPVDQLLGAAPLAA